MKKLYTLFLFSFLVLEIIRCQVPHSMNYQAVARNTAGAVISNQLIGVRFTIRDGSATGAVAYRETNSITTNQFGLFTTAIGTGTAVTGTFSGINWATGTKFMQVEIDAAGGANYVDMGTSQLLSVPYAMLAKRAETDEVDDADANPSNELQTLSLSGDVLSISGGNTVNLWEQGRVSTDNGNFNDATYTINNKRYVLNATAAQSGTSIPISHSVLLDLCADEDGCKVLVGLSEWDNSTQTEFASPLGFQWLYYSANSHWRVDRTDGTFTSGVDGNGGTEHLLSPYGQCYLTDGHYANYTGQGDASPGLELLLWNSYTGPTRKCKLIIED